MKIFSNLLIAAALTTSLSAASVFVDFGRTDNISLGNINNITGSGGTYTVPTIANLVDEDGNLSGIALSASGGSFAAAGANYGTEPTDYPLSISGQPISALEDSIFIRQNAGGTNFITITLGNLSLANTYDLEIYGARGNNGENTVVEITDDAGATTTTFDAFNNSTTLVTGTGLVPDASGVITFTVTTANAVNTDAGALNFLSITPVPVPEPTTGLLALLGGLGLMRRRRA